MVAGASIAGFHIVIPARYSSVRLPGKALKMIAGAPLVEHVFRCATRAQPDSIAIATDDKRIMQAAAEFGAQAVMTSTDHQSGSDRIAEVADIKGWSDDTLVVNLQGDEPLMPAICLRQVARMLIQSPAADAASLYWPIDDVAELADPNVVKVVLDDQGMALSFSRESIPPDADQTHSQPRTELSGRNRHVGLYAYRVGTLRRFRSTAPAELELKERLEQLRILSWGGQIAMEKAIAHIPAGVDTADDLARVRGIIVE